MKNIRIALSKEYIGNTQLLNECVTTLKEMGMLEINTQYLYKIGIVSGITPSEKISTVKQLSFVSSVDTDDSTKFTI